MTKHRRVIFNGDGYSEAWVEEAKRRGLPNLKTMVDAVDTLVTEKSVKLFEKFGIFTKSELESRVEILYESYIKTVNIEIQTMIDMMARKYMPAAVKYTKILADSINAVENAGMDATVQMEMLKVVQEKLTAMNEALKNLRMIEEKIKKISDVKEKAFYIKDNAVKAMEDLRKPTDELELVMDKSMWPVPTYGDMLFEV